MHDTYEEVVFDSFLTVRYRRFAIETFFIMNDLSRKLTETLNPKQLELLKGMTATTALRKTGNFLKLLELSAKEHEIDLDKLRNDAELDKKLLALREEYQRRLTRLNKQTMDDFTTVGWPPRPSMALPNRIAERAIGNRNVYVASVRDFPPPRSCDSRPSPGRANSLQRVVAVLLGRGGQATTVG